MYNKVNIDRYKIRVDSKIDNKIRLYKSLLMYGWYTVSTKRKIIVAISDFANFCNVPYETVRKKYFKELLDAGIVYDYRRIRRLPNQEDLLPWGVLTFSIDFDQLISMVEYLSDEKLPVNTIEWDEQCDLLFTNYINYLREKKNVDLSQNEKDDTEHLEKLVEENKEYINLLNEVNDDKIKMLYLTEGKKRLTSLLCGTPNPDHHQGEVYQKRYRYLCNALNCDKEDIVEFDVNASIYRLSYEIGNGVVRTGGDIYEMIYDECGFGKDFISIRPYFKKILMPIYMNEGGCHHRAWLYRNYGKPLYSKNGKYIEGLDSESKIAYDKIIEHTGMELIDVLLMLKEAMHKVLNLDKFYKADIFILESNLHILMHKRFKDMGIKTYNVYDGFYFDKRCGITQKEFNKVYRTSVRKLIFKPVESVT